MHLEQTKLASTDNTDSSCTLTTTTTSQAPSQCQSAPHFCYSTKCRLLVAKGIHRTPMLCANSRNMCSGCLHENLRHRKMERLENEVLEDATPNNFLAPLLHCLQKPTSLREFRIMMQHLPTMSTHRRYDHIYGAAWYLANSFGFSLLETNTTDCIDPSLAPP